MDIAPKLTDARRVRWHKLAASLQALLTPGSFRAAAFNDSVRTSVRRCAEALGCTVGRNDTEAVLLKRLLQRANALNLTHNAGGSRSAPAMPFFNDTNSKNTDTLDAVEHKLQSYVNYLGNLNGATPIPVSGTAWALNNPKAVLERKLLKRASQQA